MGDKKYSLGLGGYLRTEGSTQGRRGVGTRGVLLLGAAPEEGEEETYQRQGGTSNRGKEERKARDDFLEGQERKN